MILTMYRFGWKIVAFFFFFSPTAVSQLTEVVNDSHCSHRNLRMEAGDVQAAACLKFHNSV